MAGHWSARCRGGLRLSWRRLWRSAAAQAVNDARPTGEELPKKGEELPFSRTRQGMRPGNRRRPEGGIGAWRIDQDHHGLDWRR